MKWIAKIESPESFEFSIELDKTVGYYLYVLKDKFCTHDYLQDTLQSAMEVANEDFFVPFDAWQEVKES